MTRTSLITSPLLFLALISTGCSNDAEQTGPGAVDWTTGSYSLRADEFFLEADGVRFVGNDSMIIDGNPGDGMYMSVELEWLEHGVPMRLYIYLDSDGTEWWSDEIRTYDGAGSDGTQWVYYYGDFFRTPVGQPFQGDVDLTSNDADNPVTGRLHFRNMVFSAF